MVMGKRRRTARRMALAAAAVVLLALVVVGGRPLVHIVSTALADRESRAIPPPGHVDDASHLNATPVREVVRAAADALEAERQIGALIVRARREGLPLAIAGARHTMGGHTIAPDGIVLDMTPLSHVRYEAESRLLVAGAGARWREIIPFLDGHGRSVAIMQSNNSFTVAGSISANCHGWQHGRPPIATSVRSLRLVRADGEVVRCSRTENGELFSLVLGGYGLFGVILEVELETVPNERYVLEHLVVPAAEIEQVFLQRVNMPPAAGLAYARLGVVPESFLEEAVLNVFRQSPCSTREIPALGDPSLAGIKRTIFRGSVGSDYGKALRWEAETALSQHVTGKYFSRNQLLNDGVEIYENRSDDSTDILHEYFVPPGALAGFIDDLRRLVPGHEADLLNVTVRHVLSDPDSFLRYADRELFALVLLFNQKRTDAAERDLESLTRELIDAALARGGRYYLPYRLHATPEQFRRAYPKADEFFALKRQYDPGEVFVNEFYLRYGR
jgi:FAD/FMN-containing dehydrogenase